MAIRRAQAKWRGDLAKGKGQVETGSGTFKGSYSFGTRFEEEEGSNPEELVAAAIAACFSMALAHGLAQAGHTPEEVATEAATHLEKGEGGFGITRIVLTCRAQVPGISAELFREKADEAKAGCPISRALSATPIELEAHLTSS